MKKGGIISMVMLSLAAASLAAAQPWGGWRESGGRGMKSGYPCWYESAGEERIEGEVISVEQVAPFRRRGAGTALKISAGAETYLVHLGPQWYLERQDITIAAGDTVDVKGVKAMRRGNEIVLAAEVKKDGAVLRLRDETGVPLWAGRRRSPRER